MTGYTSPADIRCEVVALELHQGVRILAHERASTPTEEIVLSGRLDCLRAYQPVSCWEILEWMRDELDLEKHYVDGELPQIAEDLAEYMRKSFERQGVLVV